MAKVKIKKAYGNLVGANTIKYSPNDALKTNPIPMSPIGTIKTLSAQPVPKADSLSNQQTIMEMNKEKANAYDERVGYFNQPSNTSGEQVIKDIMSKRKEKVKFKKK